MCSFSFKVKQVSSKEPEENCHLSSPTSENAYTPVTKAPAETNVLNVALLFAAAVLYDFAVGGAVEILGPFVMKAPLSWSATQVTSFSFHVCVCVCLFVLRY